MTSQDLSNEQAAALRDKIAPMAGYLYRLVSRMERQGFPPDDPLLRVAKETSDKASHLHMSFHYLTCRGQVG